MIFPLIMLQMMIVIPTIPFKLENTIYKASKSSISLQYYFVIKQAECAL